MAAVITSPTILNTVSNATTLDGTEQLDQLIDHPIYGSRPVLRGRFHQLGAAVSLPGGLVLVSSVGEPGHRGAALVYAITALVMFSTSACYHRLAQSVIARFWMRRLDHSMIFVHMAGATTPLALLGIGGPIGSALVACSWTLALVGAALKMTRLTADHDPCPWLFPLLGSLPMIAVPSLATGGRAAEAILLVIAGLLYAAGATCFVKKAPNPQPTVFGYHEIWHVFTLVAAACEFGVMYGVVS